MYTQYKPYIKRAVAFEAAVFGLPPIANLSDTILQGFKDLPYPTFQHYLQTMFKLFDDDKCKQLIDVIVQNNIPIGNVPYFHPTIILYAWKKGIISYKNCQKFTPLSFAKFLAPELYELSQQSKTLQSTPNQSVLGVIFSKATAEIADFRDSNSKFKGDFAAALAEYRVSRLTWFNRPEIGFVLQDDVENLQSFIISQSNMDFNQRYNLPLNQSFFPFSTFCPEATLIDIATIKNSFKCFKFLLLNGSLAQEISSYFAAFHGNMEILHILEEHNGFDLKSAFIGSILGFHPEIYTWILSHPANSNRFNSDDSAATLDSNSNKAFFTFPGFRVDQNDLQHALIGNMTALKIIDKALHEQGKNLDLFKSTMRMETGIWFEGFAYLVLKKGYHVGTRVFAKAVSAESKEVIDLILKLKVPVSSSVIKKAIDKDCFDSLFEKYQIEPSILFSLLSIYSGKHLALNYQRLAKFITPETEEYINQIDQSKSKRNDSIYRVYDLKFLKQLIEHPPTQAELGNLVNI